MRRAAAFLSGVSLLACLSSCEMTEIPSREVSYSIDAPPKMLFLGDSIAAGYGLEGYTAGDLYSCPSYANLLKVKYDSELGDKCGHEMVNRAVSGDTSADLIELIRSGELDNDLKDSDAVVISVGGNDLLDIMLSFLSSLGITEKGTFDSGSFDLFSAASGFLSMNDDVDKALEQFGTNIRIISDELSKRTDGKVFVQTLYDPLEHFSNFKKVTDFSEKKIGRLNEIISDNAAERYTVIDVAADFKGKADELTNIAGFDIHPNAEGHKVIADDVDAAFRTAGFSYMTTEYGEKRLTKQGRTAIGGGIAGLLAAITAITAVLLHMKKKEN